MHKLFEASNLAKPAKPSEFSYEIARLGDIVLIRRVKYSMFDWDYVKKYIQQYKDDIYRVILDGALGDDCSGLFEGCHKLREVMSTCTVCTSYVTNMERMFAGCINLKKVNIEDWDLLKVNNTKDILKDCDVLNNYYLMHLLQSLGDVK